MIKLGVSGGVSGLASLVPKGAGFDLNTVLNQANVVTANLGSLEMILEGEPNSEPTLATAQKSFGEYLSAISKIDQLFENAENDLLNKPTTLRRLLDYGDQQANLYFLELQHGEFLMTLDTTEIATLHHFKTALSRTILVHKTDKNILLTRRRRGHYGQRIWTEGTATPRPRTRAG